MQSLIKVLIPRQLFMLLVLSTGILNHVILIPNLLTAAGRDSWLSVIVAYPISIAFTWLIYYIVKNSPNEGFFSLIRNRLGRAFSTIMSIPIILYLFISSYVTLRDLMIWLNAYFLADSTVFQINCILIVVCLLITLMGVKTMAISSGFLLPLVMILGILISLINTTLKDPSLLLPVLSEGYTPLLKGCIYVFSGLLEIYLVVLLQPFSEGTIKFKQLLILLTIFTGLIMGPLTASIMEFGPIESVNIRYPAYEQWRVLSIGAFINNLDFFALFQWLSGAVIRIGLFMYLIGALFTQKRSQYRLNWKLMVFLYLLLFGLLTIKFETYYFYKAMYQYLLPISTVFFLVQILLSAFIIKILIMKDKKNGGSYGG
ncbi:endospore germination permease [Peribacillus acanthi]|uniref:endospore germination permease n=1 Tax=Peribacillus acanthi TaxID=2171554 RepID=UPI000D3E3C0B|nr:endospore germination permease [Peribacillus acanthi]